MPIRALPKIIQGKQEEKNCFAPRCELSVCSESCPATVLKLSQISQPVEGVETIP